jgi:flagellar motor component MotA
MSKRELPVRASLENLRKQAKALHKAFGDAESEAVARIREHLPRAASLSDEDLGMLTLSLQEAQHVLAKEYGCGTWEQLRERIELTLNAFLNLGQGAFQEVLRQVDQQDVTRALSTAPERVREAFYTCMSRRVVRFIDEEIQAEGPWSSDEVRSATQRILDTTRQVADEHGFDWPPAPMSGSFDDLARLPDRDTQVVLREVSQLDLTRAMIGASEAVRGRMLMNMSRRVRTFIVEEGERLAPGLPAHEPEASRQRVLEWAQAMGRDQRITWPPRRDSEPWSGTLEEPGAPVRGQEPLPELDDLSIDDLVELYKGFTEQARREGILSLDEFARGRGPIVEGLRLALDGTDPGLVERMLRTRAETMARNRRLRLTMMRDGVAALQAGGNPRLIWHEMQAHYLDPDAWEPAHRLNEEITGAQLRDWIERGWLGTGSPAQIAELFLHAAHAARNEGLGALMDATELIDHPLLRETLRAVIEQREAPHDPRARMDEAIDAEVAGLESRWRAVISGTLGVMAGHKPYDVEQAVRRSVEAM